MVHSDLEVPIPAVYRGLVIGKGGETLKQLQDEFHVRVIVPKGDTSRPVRVKGPMSKCQACAEEIQKMIQKHCRAPKRAKAKKPAHSSHSPYPPECPLCKSMMKSIREALLHLQSSKHQTAVLDACSDVSCQMSAGKSLDLQEVQGLLKVQGYRDLHEAHGFNPEDLLAASAVELQRLSRVREIHEDSLRLSADPAWLKVEGRMVVEWDDTRLTGAVPLKCAPDLVDMMERCRLPAPPVARVPTVLPAPLPQRNHKQKSKDMLRGAHKYPGEPGSGRLGIAIMRKFGLPECDIVCSTSFIKALAGDSSRVKDTYYLQKFNNAVCVLHVPKHFYNQDDAGHAVERLLCGEAAFCQFAATTLRIDGTSFFVTSEVDAVDESGELLEIKSSKHGKAVSKEGVLQTLVNGSKAFLCCSLDEGQTKLLDAWHIPAKQAQQEHQQSLIYYGQHARFMLAKVLQHFAENQSAAAVWKLTFNDCKLPVFDLSETVQVLPLGLDS
mmetsp:Transcript_47651/g.66136  ORF Transcript_47651/g.66136 Transcript_47651/m.66136 type:complete len:496 (-) Transcript_47651:111-1598(-)